MRHLLHSFNILFILAFSAVVYALHLDTRPSLDLNRLLMDQIGQVLQSASSTPLDTRSLADLLGTLESELDPQINHILNLKQWPLSVRDQERLMDTLVVKVNGISADWATDQLNPWITRNHLDRRILMWNWLDPIKRMFQEPSHLRYRFSA